MKERDLAPKKSIKTKLQHDKYQYTFGNKVMREIRKAKAIFFIAVLNKARGNVKIIWSHLKKLTGESHSNRKMPEINLNGTILSQPNKIAEISTLLTLWLKSPIVSK